MLQGNYVPSLPWYDATPAPSKTIDFVWGSGLTGQEEATSSAGGTPTILPTITGFPQDPEPSGVHHRPPPPAPTTALPSAVPSIAHGAESEVCLPLVCQSSEFVSAVVPGDAVVAVVHQSCLHVMLALAQAPPTTLRLWQRQPSQ